MGTIQRQFKKMQRYLQSSLTVSGFFIFLLASGIIGYSIATPTFIDPDAWYHTAITQQMIEEGWAITDFPWLQFTTLKEAYVDHHLLYHIALVPFFLAFGPLLGMKIATVIFGAAVILTIYTILRKTEAAYPFFWSLLLLGSYDFLFRLSLSKGNSISFILLYSGWYAMMKKKYIPIFFISFFYVWAYGGFIQILIVAASCTLFDIFQYYQKRKFPTLSKIYEALRIPLVTLCGIIAGLVIHPSFPKNIFFLWEQIVQIGVVNYQNVISVGAEWYPRSFDSMIFGSMIVSTLLMLSLFAVLQERKKIPRTLFTSGIMALFFFLLTFKSQRYIEYAVPWLILFSATSIPLIIKKYKEREKKEIPVPLVKKYFYGVCSGAILSIAFLTLLDSTTRVRTISEKSSSFEEFEGVGNFLQNNAPKNAIVFHDDWDSFPLLWYHAPTMHYIVGLDPTFFYRYEAALYHQWKDITLGKEKENLHHIISHNFRASYVFIDSDHEAFEKNIRASKGFTQIYEDQDGTIFTVESVTK